MAFCIELAYHCHNTVSANTLQSGVWYSADGLCLAILLPRPVRSVPRDSHKCLSSLFLCSAAQWLSFPVLTVATTCYRCSLFGRFSFAVWPWKCRYLLLLMMRMMMVMSIYCCRPSLDPAGLWRVWPAVPLSPLYTYTVQPWHHRAVVMTRRPSSPMVLGVLKLTIFFW